MSSEGGGERAGNKPAGSPTALVNAWQHARSKLVLRGEALLEDFERLVIDLPDQEERKVEWVLTGDIDGQHRCYLTLQANTVVTLECQRCLTLFDLPLKVDTRVQLVKAEEDLEAEDVADDDPDMPDLVLGSTRFDILEFVEDELILALPYVPKHEVCPSLPEGLETAEGAGDTDRPSPFAVLAELKKS